ncbi:AraC family transcriptional regulator [Chitinophaga filiformis]|uniref:helix-turn-helix transcriptional regulator n=1 Tax=Chitinophaga filiformis TaxID=104663 RepID=UPI001F3B9004|nr:AraC family transcriptional regulator [Chitinophaga filiformis]MCF6406839.1 AraC family transcriptional regulator [Chitinophaga filiformis]
MPFEIKHIASNQIVRHSDAPDSDANSSDLIEHTNRIALPFADAVLSHWQFDGIRMIHTNWHYKTRSDMAFRFDEDVVQMHFNLRGKLLLNSVQHGNLLSFEHNQHNILYGNSNAGTISNEHLHASQFQIQFPRERFLKLTENANDTLKRFSENIVSGKPVLIADQHLPIDLPMQQTIDAILNCKYQQGLKKMFLLSKAIELLVLQAEAFNRPPKKAVARTDYDKDRIHYAREYVLQHIDNPPGLSELARIAGLNEYKLKRGFKEMFQITVFGYLAEKRLELSRDYLSDPNKSVTEIANLLGYSSVQHFSAAFKKKFGHPPREEKM